MPGEEIPGIRSSEYKGSYGPEGIHGYDPNKEYYLYHFDPEDGRAHWKEVEPPGLWETLKRSFRGYGN
jgi:hypothetical protein